VLLSSPLHASSNFTVSVQLENKMGFKQKSLSVSKALVKQIINIPSISKIKIYFD
jgi:azurin